ncbi:hypothetical protein K7432_006628 [Basidiobolus ranarum]|uniref:Uncharacterized protein n=1 Tax=Basidiobolus ranarum TaxID=34480 RepID=A0ABR2W1B6_9FUNG
MTNLLIETQTLHQFPHVVDWDLEYEEIAPKKDNNDEESNSHTELLQFASTIHLPTKEEFRQIVQDKEKSAELYSALLEACSQLDELTLQHKEKAPKNVDTLPQYWTVLGSPYYHKARTMALRQFHSPQSSYFLPNNDQMILDLIHSWNVFPDSIFQSKHGRERILAWLKTLYILERAAVRNRVVGVRMSNRHHRKYDGKTLTRSLLPKGYTVTHQMVKRVVLMRDTSKHRGSWNTMDSEKNFWKHYQEALVDLRGMSRHEAEAHLTNLVKKDQNHYGKF